jgi:hypothetical protein
MYSGDGEHGTSTLYRPNPLDDWPNMIADWAERNGESALAEETYRLQPTSRIGNLGGLAITTFVVIT